MADFVQKAAVKSAVRKLASPIESISAFTTLVQDILTDNPWGCTSYVSAGATIAPVVKGAESYTGNVIYEDALAKTVGRITVRAPTQAAFNTDIITILAESTIRTAMGGSPSHDSSEDVFSVALKCHHANGELYTVTLKRDSITVSSFEDDAIMTGLETWADTVAILA